MKTKPILFKPHEVRATLEGRMTQFRRIVKPQPSVEFCAEVGRYHPSRIDRRTGELYPGDEVFGASDLGEDYPCPHGQPGDRLWVKETFAKRQDCIDGTDKARHYLMYRADGGDPKDTCNWHDFGDKWIPSIFMPRWASRITLEITAVRCERLRDISEADAWAEGVIGRGTTRYESEGRDLYRALWESINGTGSWALNPWVWVIEFRKI